MILSMTFQCKLFFICILFGLIGGLAYNIIYIAYKVFFKGKAKALKYCLDITYWLLISISLFLTMLYFNYGEIRPFSILGASLGLIFYHTIFFRYVDLVLIPLFSIVRKVIQFLCASFITPFKLLVIIIKKFILILKKACNKHKFMRK